MNGTSILRWSLLLVVFGSLGVYAVKKAGNHASAATTPALHDVGKAEVVVTYFTTDVRCTSCLTIEELSRRAIEQGFPAEVADGRVVFRVLNTDRPENAVYKDHYELANKTVIVSHQANGREVAWTNRQDVWLLLDEPEPFFAYVREPVRGYLGKD